MSKHKSFSPFSPWLLLAIGLFLAAGFALMPFYVYHLNNDGVSYLSIAAKYAQGSATAISSYWGPLYSWLIAIFLKLGVSGFVAVRVINLLCGAAILVAIWTLARQLNVQPFFRVPLLLVSSVLLLTYALDVISPDLLLACLLLWYIVIALDERSITSRRLQFLIGLLGGIAFLAKSVALPLFCLHLFFLHGVWWVSGKRFPIVARSFALSIFVFACIAAPWIAIISKQTGHMTVGESARVIHASYNPLLGRSIPMYTQGLLPPPDALATSMWDDPTQSAAKDWSPFESLGKFIDQIKIVLLNAIAALTLYATYSWLLLPLIGFSFVAACTKSSWYDRRVARIFGGTAVLITGLYLPFVVDLRYLWVVVLLGLVWMFALVSKLYEHHIFSRLQMRVLLCGIGCCFLVLPLWQLAMNFRDGEGLYTQAMAIADVLPLRDAAIASDSWKQGLYFSSFVDAQYFGQPKMSSDDDINQQLRSQNIDYYIVWGKVPALQSYADVTPPALSGVHVYRKNIQ